MARLSKLAFAAAAPLLLLGCLLTPGKFASSLDVARDGVFTFRYNGEIILLSNRSFLDAMEVEPEFAAHCEGEEGEERACAPDEIAEQRAAHEEERRAMAQKEASERAQMAALFGGLDPTNEATMDAFAARLEREAGWKSVKHRGGGVFDVDYEISGRLDHDFVFPVFPRFDFIVPFVTVTRRDDNALLLRAPALGQSGAAAGASAPGGLSGESRAEGTFTLTTDAAIATNNSEEGAVTQSGRQRIEWRISPLNRTAPEALLRP